MKLHDDAENISLGLEKRDHPPIGSCQSGYVEVYKTVSQFAHVTTLHIGQSKINMWCTCQETAAGNIGLEELFIEK